MRKRSVGEGGWCSQQKSQGEWGGVGGWVEGTPVRDGVTARKGGELYTGESTPTEARQGTGSEELRRGHQAITGETCG